MCKENNNSYKYMKIWNARPAWKWDEATPVGNGRLGAMIYGNIEREIFQINEETLWAGGKHDSNNPEANEYLPKVRELLFNDQANEAEKLAGEKMLGEPVSIDSYETAGDIVVKFENEYGGIISNYRRELDLSKAVASVEYDMNDCGRDNARKWEVFASAVRQVIIAKFAPKGKEDLCFSLELEREKNADVRLEDDILVMEGRSNSGQRMRFALCIGVKADGNEISYSNNRIKVKTKGAALLYVSANTEFRHDNYIDVCKRQINEAREIEYDVLLQEHIREYQSLFNRVDFILGEEAEIEKLCRKPIEERIKAIREGESDILLPAQYLQFGRYLLISSSRPGCLPANLQGIWNKYLNAPWNSDYHLNINLQMNYWPAEVCNISECHKPLIEFIKSLTEPGRKTARIHYGCRGFVAHHLTDIFGHTTPSDGVWGVWPMGVAWLCSHVFEHYKFTLDLKYLEEEAYPILKECAEFFVDYLVETEDGLFLTNPSTSPENSYILPDGKHGYLCMGSYMDTEIIYELFTNVITSSKILGKDEAFAKRLQYISDHLPGLNIGKHGQLMEWYRDYDETDIGHRHMSHLYALFPGCQITPEKTPELAKACEVTLHRRLTHGGGHTGWSRAWLILFYARLYKGEKAREHFHMLLKKCTLPNLFDLHPPFQIDGNFGAAAGIAETLLQSHDGFIHLLPALPEEWNNGYIIGLKARGNYDVSMWWKDGMLKRAEVVVNNPGQVKIKPGRNEKIRRISFENSDRNIEISEHVDPFICFNAAGKGKYELSF